LWIQYDSARGLDELETVLDGPRFLSVEDLYFDLRPSEDDLDFRRLGEILDAKLVNMESLNLYIMHPNTSNLFQGMSSHRITKLWIQYVACDSNNQLCNFEEEFDAIRCFENLKHLSFGFNDEYFDTWNQAAIDKLASALEGFTLLEYVLIDGMTKTHGPQEEQAPSVESIVQALKSKETLKYVDCEIFVERHPNQGMDDIDDMDDALSPKQHLHIQTGPKINKLCREYRLPENRKYQAECHDQWAEVVTLLLQSEEYSFEIFHFFFSQLPLQVLEAIPERVVDLEDPRNLFKDPLDADVEKIFSGASDKRESTLLLAEPWTGTCYAIASLLIASLLIKALVDPLDSSIRVGNPFALPEDPAE
jgi:hypothetical protein